MRGTPFMFPFSMILEPADSDRHVDCHRDITHDTRQTFVDSRTTVHISLFPVRILYQPSSDICRPNFSRTLASLSCITFSRLLISISIVTGQFVDNRDMYSFFFFFLYLCAIYLATTLRVLHFRSFVPVARHLRSTVNC
ncbi:hypothetical protein BJY52DRAFT_799667 [Lactarius psammicola]|nr:hypothetical protein BJY52DRAFT_799667 [Lactarius psammicola]